MALTREKFYIVVPKAATNLLTNPSFESTTTPWNANGVGVAISISTSYQRRGAKSCEVTPVSGILGGINLEITLTSGVQYTFSADIKDVLGQSFTIGIENTTGGFTTSSWTGTGYWLRKSITYTAVASGTHILHIYRPAIASTEKFYVDGCMLEEGAESTYFDGDYWGQTLQRDFGWNGTRHASTSYRLARTRAGGTLLDIDTYAKVLGHIGLGRAPEQHFTSEINADGELYQATKVMPRDFVINLVFSGTTAEVATKRKALLAALQLDKTPIRQPIVLRYQGVDANGEWMTEPVNIPCVYMGGLEKSATTYGAEKCAVQFRMTSPYMEMDGEVGNALGYSTSVTNFADIGYRDTDGIWKAMSTGVNGTVYCMVQGPDGSIYIGGDFTLAGGVANTAYVAKWNGSAFSALGTGMNSTVRALAFDAAGNLYAGGNFTLAGGVANTAYIAKWNGTAWTALSTGMNNTVYAVAFDKSGNLYAGGAFTLAGGVAANRVAKWNGTAFSALSTGTDSLVMALALDSSGNLYCGGYFTSAGGVANTAYIAKWNGTAFSALSTGMNNIVYTLAFDAAGNLYGGGAFTLAGGVAANRVAKWNGTAFSALSTGMNDNVYTLAFTPSGAMYAGGFFDIAGGAAMPDCIAAWRGNVWQPVDINVNDSSAYVYSILTINDGRVYIGGSWAGSTATSATTTVSNNTGTKAYPFFQFFGPGTIWQIKNYTNDNAIYLNNLTLLTGESAYMDCNPFRFRIHSSWRGDLQNYVLPGSTNITIEPGNNNISAYLMGSGAGSGINMIWKATYSSIDEALR